MNTRSFFQDALADFAQEAAWGGAVRHLADLGYTARQIADKLDFPVSYEKVRRAVWERLVDTEVILLEEPGSVRGRMRSVFVREYDRYGKASFRQVWEDAGAGGKGRDGNGKSGHGRGGVGDLEQDGPIVADKALGQRQGPDGAGGWKEKQVSMETGPSVEELARALHRGIEAGGRERAYVSCDFGLFDRTAGGYEKLLEALDERQREYLTGLLWAGKRVYHRLDKRMEEIVLRLYGTGDYHGKYYLLDIRETVTF